MAKDYRQLLQKQGLDIVGELKAIKSPHTLRCLTCEHVFTAGILGKLQAFQKYGSSGCPECHRRKRLSKTTETARKIVQKLQNHVLIDEYTPTNLADRKYLTLIENVHCGHQLKVHLPSFVEGSMECQICNGRHDYLSSLVDSLDIGLPYKIIKKGYHFYIDVNDYRIHFFDINLINDLELKSRRYLFNLHKEYEGNKLFIFSDEIEHNRELVRLKIRHYLGISNLPKVYARNTVVREVDKKEKRDFLIRNHIQGDSNTKINLGCYCGDKLVALMTFCNPRVIMNKRDVHNSTKWELSRYATDNSVHAIGTASKLLNFFKKNYEWDEIYSYADKRWSSGNMYHKLGFELVSDNKPEYFYIKDGIRKHRWGFRKDALKERYPSMYDPKKTEFQMTNELGIRRVWDCGTLKFVCKKSGINVV